MLYITLHTSSVLLTRQNSLLLRIQVAGLRHRCLRQLIVSMSEETMLQYFEAGDLTQDAGLSEACMTFWARPVCG